MDVTACKRVLLIALVLFVGAMFDLGAMAQSYNAGNDAARRAAEQAAQERARAAAAQLEMDRQRQQREQADAQRRQQNSPPQDWPSTAPRPQERTTLPSAERTERQPEARRDPGLERAAAAGQALAAQKERFNAYTASCQASAKLAQPECWAASEELRARALTQDLWNRMGQKRWEDYRFFNRIAPGFEQDIQRMNAQVVRAEKAREDWARGVAPDALAMRSRLESNRMDEELDRTRRDAEKDIRMKGQPAWQTANLSRDERTGSADIHRCYYTTANGQRFDANMRVVSCPASVKYDPQRGLMEF